MANNRMWLTNKRTGAKVLLAKYYPSTGWYPYHDDIHDKLMKLFESNEPPASPWGDNDWTLEYEQIVEPRIEGGTPPQGILTPVPPSAGASHE